jgi:hypothetical protein
MQSTVVISSPPNEGCPVARRSGESNLLVDAAASPPLTGPLSPELVLVSPPEIARMARILLPLEPAARPVAIQATAGPGRVELAGVWLSCLAMTLGPLLFILAVANG